MTEIDRPAPGTREELTELAVDRHPGTQHLIRLFAWSHLPPRLREVSQPFATLALLMIAKLNDGPELSTGLRKLREAKDCMVTQALEDLDPPGPAARP
jgi:hypothetical protein